MTTNNFTVAHRGLRELEGKPLRENSIAALEAAWRSGLSVETDIRLTSDNIPVISHDRWLPPLTEPIDALDYDRLNRESEFGAETLEEALKVQARLKQEGIQPPPHLQLEIKPPTNVSNIIDVVRPFLDSGALSQDDIYITAFNYDHLLEAKALLSDAGYEVKTGLLLGRHELEYTALGRDDIDALGQLIIGTIRDFDTEGVVTTSESLALLRPAAEGADQQHQEGLEPFIFDVLREDPIGDVRRRFEEILAYDAGGAIQAGCYLDRSASQQGINAVHLPMSSPPKMAETYSAKASMLLPGHRISGHSVANRGNNRYQIIRALGCISDDGCFTTDYPHLVDEVMVDAIQQIAQSSADGQVECSVDTTRTYQFDSSHGIPGETVAIALERYLASRGIHYSEPVGDPRNQRTRHFHFSAQDLPELKITSLTAGRIQL